MNKKAYYWIFGILIALITVFVVWGLARNSQQPGQEPSPVTETASEERTGTGGSGNSHEAMGHGTAGAEERADSPSSAYSAYIQEQDTIMSRMMQDMELAEDTGNAALDFISGMIPHHVAAVEMAESYLEHGGSHNQLKPLAQDIITAQRDEIAAMETMYQEIQASGKKDQQQADAYREAYAKMMQGHHAGHSMGSVSDSIDTAFAEGMLMHHQMAVDMAKDILGHTDDSAVLELAQQIIDTQEEEIKIMQSILDTP